MSDFEEALRLEMERRTPVRCEVRKNWDLITEARGRGEPLDAIFRALTRMGASVGKGPSSFRAAVKYLDTQGSARSPHQNAAPAPATPLPTVNVEQDRNRLADTRFESDF